MSEIKSAQNRYCCVPLCKQKGSTGPNGEKVGFFTIPTDKYLKEQWLHAIRGDPGKHFSITDSTTVCSLHFTKEHLKKKLGIRRLNYVDGAVPSVFAWKRSSSRKRPAPKVRIPLSSLKKSKTRTSLNMSAAESSSSKTLGMDVNNARRNSDCSEENESRLTTSETGVASPIRNNSLSYENLQRKVAEILRAFT